MNSGWNRIRRSDFFIRLRHWEYWPFGIIQFPLFIYYPWLSLRAGSPTFFSGANPGITMGGMFGESKFEVLTSVPADLVPKTLLMRQPVSAEMVLDAIRQNDMIYPLILKPDVGERGFMVKRISSPAEIQPYVSGMKYDFLIQELVDLPFEAGVFYQRFPDEPKGKVTSVVLKEMLTVEGDGSSTFGELILACDRAKLQWKRLSKIYRDRINDVVPKGERIEVVSIGNHCLGTKFINGNHLITPKLSEAFDEISSRIKGFYFGRFDLRFASFADLEAGNVRILELNGCGAEPSHIYDPAFSLSEAVKTLFAHWRAIFEIARQNRARGYQFLPVKEALKHYRLFREKTR